MSIAYQAEFWRRSVNEFNDKDGKFAGFEDGFVEFSNLLKTIYENYKIFEVSTAGQAKTKYGGITAEDLDNYHNLTNTLDCLFYLSRLGILKKDGNVNFLEISKKEFSANFKGSATLPLAMLEKKRFYFSFQKSGKETSSYKTCDTLNLFYDNNVNLIPAMSYFAKATLETSMKEDYQQTRFLFYVADFDSVLFGQSTKQTDINPLKQNILNVAGNKQTLLANLVNVLQKTCEGVKSYIQPYVIPKWQISFYKNKKIVLSLTLRPDRVIIELHLTFEGAKRVIQTRKNYPQSIHDAIDRLNCCGCGRCKNQGPIGNAIVSFEGIKLCSYPITNFMNSESRCLYLNLNSDADIEAIAEIIKQRTEEK